MVDIAKILTSYPKGAKLYSPICGECELDCLCYGGDVITVVYGGREDSDYYDELDRNHVLCFDRYGRYETTGEVMLFPSKNCREWISKDDMLHCLMQQKETWEKRLECYNKEDNLAQYKHAEAIVDMLTIWIKKLINCE